MNPEEIKSLTNENLAAILTDAGVAVGPITDTTRLVYERKLARMQNITPPVSVPAVEVVEEEQDDEEEEEEEEIIAGSMYEEEPSERLTSTYQRFTSPLASKVGNTPLPNYIGTPGTGTPGTGTPGSSRLNTSLNTSLTRRPLREEVQFTSLRNAQAASSASAAAPKKKGMSIMVKLLALIILCLITWLIYINFESPASKPLLTTNH